MVKRSILVALFLSGATALFAGDVATFVNLGFSADSRYFMFGQYGVTESSVAYADLYIVDVAADRFVPDGVRTERYRGVLTAGQDGSGALLNLLGENAAFTARYRINHLLIGRELYLLVDGQEPKSALQFRDFQTSTDYTVALNQQKFTKDGEVSASFTIDLTVKPEKGAERRFTVGIPGFKRPGVESYRIRRIVLSPDSCALVFVVEKEEKDKSGANVRFMVDAVRMDP